MTGEEFENIVNDRLTEIILRTKRKGSEYSHGGDRLSNIRLSSTLLRSSMQEVVFAFMSKHIISVRDMVQYNENYPLEMWVEKLGDIIVYCLLMEAVVKEGRNNANTKPEGATFRETNEASVRNPFQHLPKEPRRKRS